MTVPYSVRKHPQWHFLFTSFLQKFKKIEICSKFQGFGPKKRIKGKQSGRKPASNQLNSRIGWRF